MAHPKTTSRRVASKASKQLRSSRTSKSAKSVAGQRAITKAWPQA